MGCRVLIGCASIILLAADRSAADDSTDRARAAVEAFGKNIRSFEKYRCRFAICQGTAATLDDLQAGRYDLLSMGAHLTVADGPRLKFDRFGRTPIHRDSKMAYESLVERFTYLTDGTMDFHYENGGSALIYTSDWPNAPGDATPLTLAMSDFRRQMAPDTMLARPADFTFAPDGLQALDGRPTVAARFTGPVGKFSTTLRYAFDPNRGYLPARVVSSDGRSPESEVWLLEAKDCGHGRFFPTKYVSIHHPREPGQPFDVQLYVVTELDPDYKPTPEDLSVTLPAGTLLSLQLQQSSVWPPPLGISTRLHADDLPIVAANLEPRRMKKIDRAWLMGLVSRTWPWALALVGVLGAVLLWQLHLSRHRRRQVRLHG